ncbi:MAG TPA: hypothetical protein VE153_03920 [Myxococcus sp.]|nr:hypothetical protein [Myxococcus sp.]
MRARVLLSVLLCWLGSGCAAGVAGAIPPAAFQFHKVVHRNDSDAGGWKVAQTAITLTRVSRTHPLQASCQVEIGVPIVNGTGAVPDVVAQQAAATAADQAARFALRQRPVTSAELCDLFLLEMRRLLREAIRGVRVRRFVEPGIPQNTFVPD